MGEEGIMIIIFHKIWWPLDLDLVVSLVCLVGVCLNRRVVFHLYAPQGEILKYENRWVFTPLPTLLHCWGLHFFNQAPEVKASPFSPQNGRETVKVQISRLDGNIWPGNLCNYSGGDGGGCKRSQVQILLFICPNLEMCLSKLWNKLV